MSLSQQSLALYANPHSPKAHFIRLLLAEKKLDNYRQIDTRKDQADLAQINPYLVTPTLTDRDAVIFDLQIIVDYLDERYPFPRLMPDTPIERAHIRLMLRHLEQELYEPILAKQAKTIRTGLMRLAHSLDKAQPNRLQALSTLPVYWRTRRTVDLLPQAHAQVLQRYFEPLIQSSTFQASLLN